MIVIPQRINVSFQMKAKPDPLIITDFTIWKNHFAGTALDTICNGNGMFSIGNIEPLSITVGRNMPVSEMNIAVCCELVTEEISNPNERHVMINSTPSAI